jgi:hypothetical protein
MNAPVGGDCGGVTANTGNTLEEKSLSREMNSRATAIGAEPGRFGVTTAAGSGALAVQQFTPKDWWNFLACEQQLCALFCDRCRQFPDGASNAPINTMATAARWKTPLNMDSDYHEWCLLR